MKPDNNITKKNPFRVPEGYFESLADRTMAAIKEEEARKGEGSQPPAHSKGRTVSLRPFIALAAAIIGFAILATVMVRLVNSDRPAAGYQAGSSLYADLAFEEVDTWLLENELSLTEPEVTEIKGDEISSEAIIDYLMTEEIDLNDIYEML